MDRTLLTGVGFTVAGVVGYAVGVATPYPGRAFSVTGVMVGLTLVAVGAGGTTTGTESEREPPRSDRAVGPEPGSESEPARESTDTTEGGDDR